MSLDLIQGNALSDGADFHYWFVGRIDKWCKEQGIPFDSKKFGLRNTGDIEIKWGIYRKGDIRSEWASSSEMTGMSILIRGDCIFTFREQTDHDNIQDLRVKKEGDYIIWRERVEHTWKMLDDSVFLTLRWKASKDS